MSFPRYERYKESGVEWLGEVPEGWEVLALKRVASLKSGESITAENIEEVGEYPVYGGNGLRGYTGAPTHEGHYALIGRQGALCGNINYAQGRFWASEHAVVVSPVKQVETFWLGELLRAMNLNQYSVSAAQPGLSVEIVNNLQIPLPPLPEQQTIAAFLDRETGKIDALVAEQERLIALLKEKRQATISHAVTKGLNPAASLKDSGIEWLGEVPEGWEVKRVKQLASVISKGTTPTTVGAEFAESGVRFLKAENINGGSVNTEPEFFITEETHQILGRSALFEDDILVVIAGATTGKAAILWKGLLPSNTNQAVSFIRCSDRKYAEFINYWLSTSMVQETIKLNSVQSAQPNLSMEDLGNIPIPFPPAEEQSAIVTFLDSETAKIDTLVGEARQVISLLKERRSALISAAVTGKIDVRHLEAA